MPGIPISNWVENRIQRKHITYEKNDRLFLYSDGIIEMKTTKTNNMERKTFGYTAKRHFKYPL